MAVTTTMSLIGLYSYDSTLFDNLTLPVGVDKDDVVGNLLMETDGQEVLYPNPGFMKMAIGVWSKKELPVWEKLLATTKFEYNPIHNYDREEVVQDTEIRDLKKTSDESRKLSDNTVVDTTGNVNINVDGSDNSTGTDRQSGSTVTDERVSAFNNDTLVPRSEVTETPNTTIDRDSNEDYNSTTKTDSTGKETNAKTVDETVTRNDGDTGTVTNQHTAHMLGNIGVTTTQQMIEAEREVVKFNIVDYIVESFANRFCLQVFSL